MTEPVIPAIKVVAMPKDANADGDIFGGWILSMMDMAGGVMARKAARKRVVTVAMDEVVFHLPVYVGDTVECYAAVEKTGRTSITVRVETYVERKLAHERLKVTQGKFVFVAIDAEGRPAAIE